MAKKKSAKKPAKADSTPPSTSLTNKEASPSTGPHTSSPLSNGSKDNVGSTPTQVPQSEDVPPVSASNSSNGNIDLDLASSKVDVNAEIVGDLSSHKDGQKEVLADSPESLTNSSIKEKVSSEPENSSTESTEALKTQLEQVEAERDEIQEEYDSLVEKVATIKQRLGERFKELEAETSKAKAETEQIRISAEATLKEKLESAQRDSELALSTAIQQTREQATVDARKQAEKAFQEELSKVQNELTKAQGELTKNKEEASRIKKEVTMARELQVSQKIMLDQELSNERVAKQTLEVELEQLTAKFESNSSVSSQLNHTCELQEQEIAKLKRKICTLEEAYDSLKIKYNTEISELSKDRDDASKQLNALHAQLASQTQTSAFSAEKQQKLETEAKENQLLIGKLRHEAVILNDHLTHALRLVRKDSEGTTVDKELVSNLFVQFATCPRQDTKKFEILLLIANFLGWDEQRRKLVGLEKENPEWELQNQAAQNPPQMVGMVGKLAEFLESRRNSGIR